MRIIIEPNKEESLETIMRFAIELSANNHNYPVSFVMNDLEVYVTAGKVKK